METGSSPTLIVSGSLILGVKATLGILLAAKLVEAQSHCDSTATCEIAKKKGAVTDYSLSCKSNSMRTRVPLLPPQSDS